MSNRDNEFWLKDLRAGATQRDEALADLRLLLVRMLPQGLSKWLSPDNPEFESLVEDTVQETLSRALKGLDTFEGRSQFTTWVYKIAVRVALNELRRRRWRDVSLDGLETSEPGTGRSQQFTGHELGPEAVVERKDMVERVQRMLMEELTERQRAAMMAVSVHGVPLEEVARRMGTNRNALYKLMHDARVRLKQRLEREGLRPEELFAMFARE